MIFHDHRGSELAWISRQGAAAPVNHHDGAGRVPAHGRSLSGVPISSSSLRVSGCSARWPTTRSPSARIASRRIRRASASAISRTNVLSPLPCPRATASSAARSAAPNRIVSVSAMHTTVPQGCKTDLGSVSATGPLRDGHRSAAVSVGEHPARPARSTAPWRGLSATASGRVAPVEVVPIRTHRRNLLTPAIRETLKQARDARSTSSRSGQATQRGHLVNHPARCPVSPGSGAAPAAQTRGAAGRTPRRLPSPTRRQARLAAGPSCAGGRPRSARTTARSAWRTQG